MKRKKHIRQVEAVMNVVNKEVAPQIMLQHLAEALGDLQVRLDDEDLFIGTQYMHETFVNQVMVWYKEYSAGELERATATYIAGGPDDWAISNADEQEHAFRALSACSSAYIKKLKGSQDPIGDHFKKLRASSDH